MKTARLLYLADQLEKIPRKKFDFRSWSALDGESLIDERGDEAARSRFKACGTTACAIGWAASMPKFRRLKFKLSREGEPSFVCSTEKHPGPQEYLGLGAISALFEISSDAAIFLFMPVGAAYPVSTLGMGLPKTATPKQVAARIRKFVKKYGPSRTPQQKAKQ